MPLIGQAARWHRPSQTMAVLAMCVILVVVFSVSLNGFLSFGNLFALARNISILGILALGMAVVVIGRGLDLSQDKAVGGLELGTTITSAIFLSVILAVVTFVSLTKKDATPISPAD